MGTYTSINWYEDFEDLFVEKTFYMLFSRSSMGVHLPRKWFKSFQGPVYERD